MARPPLHGTAMTPAERKAKERMGRQLLIASIRDNIELALIEVRGTMAELPLLEALESLDQL